MNPINMTSLFQEAYMKAQKTALINKNNEITILHLLSAMIEQKDSKFVELLQACGVNNVEGVVAKTKEAISELPVVDKLTNISLSHELYKVLAEMDDMSQEREDEFVRGELFIPVIAKYDNPAKTILQEFGFDENKVNAAVSKVLKEKVNSPNAVDSEKLLEKYTIDFTAKAAANSLDPVIGRDEEIRRTMHILARRTKNNPVLIGKPGVGKTAIVEGLAQRIISGEVPESLKGKRLLGLDLVSMIAGARMRGDFEERLQGVLKAVQEKAGKIVLFIDELHTLVGAGKAEGSMDASNMLKPALARGELHCIGATTLDEYKKYIEKDSALERRFQKVVVDEPTVADTVAILRGLKERYELHHGITITDGALVAAAKLSSRYITDRFLPDKAIDLIDEAGALIKMEMDSKPEAIDKIERKIIQLNVERTVLEKDSFAKNQIEHIKKDLAHLEAEHARLIAIWEKQKAENFSVNELKNNIEKIREQIKSAKKEANWEEMGRLEYEVLPKFMKILETKENQETNVAKDVHEEKLFRQVVTEEEIAHIISKATGIDVDKMLQPQKKRLLEMENFLHTSIVGQHPAVVSVSKTIRRARAGLADESRPYGSFLFLGPSGVGKTELVKSLAKFLFQSEKNIVRIDMSELMEKHAVSRLIGSPPGYVGHEEGGTLTEAVRRKPYSVILLDEIEKAHPDVFNVLLQVLDEGHLTDGQGNIVDFKNTVVVMTSNIGSNVIQEEMLNGGAKIGFHTQSRRKEDMTTEEQYVKMKNSVMKELKNYFRPEFINRIDDIVMFHPLEKAHISDIVKLQLQKLNQKLSDQEISMIFDDKLVEHLVEVGFDPLFGARPIKRAIQNEVESFISDKILADEIVEGGKYGLTYEDGNMKLKFC